MPTHMNKDLRMSDDFYDSSVQGERFPGTIKISAIICSYISERVLKFIFLSLSNHQLVYISFNLFAYLDKL